MARMVVLAKMERMVKMEKMANRVETVAMEVIVIGDVEAMGVTEEMLINTPSMLFQIYARGLCFGELGL
jgi:hypothetical protein